MNAKDLQRFVSNNNISAEIIEFDNETKTSKQAANALNIDMRKIVKSIVLTDENEGIMVILRGIDKIDLKKLRKHTGKKWRLATPDETKKLSGYEIGSVPPISTKISNVIVDSAVSGIVYCGGGSPKNLMKIESKDIIKYSNAKVMNIRKFNSFH